jgi:hypothetical protein
VTSDDDRVCARSIIYIYINQHDAM